MDDQSRIASVRIGASMGDSTPAVKYTLENNIGSSVVTLDDSGAVVNEQEYYPFGETSFGSYAKKRYQYTGKERDEESGLYYYGARYYSAWTCRFTSVDPLASKYKQLTPYQNAGNDPIGDHDIDGMQGAKTKGDKQSGGNSSSSGGNVVKSMKVKIHSVKEGDNVWNIAKDALGDQATNKQINELKNQIIEMNKLNADGSIQPGDNLIIPKTTIDILREFNQETQQGTTTLTYSYIDGDLSNGILNLPEVEVNPPVLMGPYKPVDLGKSKTPALDIINRLEQIVYQKGGKLSDLVEPGTSIDEGWIDYAEQFGDNYYQIDKAYGGTYKGHPVQVVQHGTPKNEEITDYEILNHNNPGNNYPYGIRLLNSMGYSLLELQFKDRSTRNEVRDRLKKAGGRN